MTRPPPATRRRSPATRTTSAGSRTRRYKYSPHAYVVPTMTLDNGKGVAPLNGSPGFGRFPTISEAALVFYHAGYVVWDPSATDVPRANVTNSQFRDTKRRVRIVQDRKEYYDMYANVGPDGQPERHEPRHDRSKLGPPHGGSLKYDADGRAHPGRAGDRLADEGVPPLRELHADAGVRGGVRFRHQLRGAKARALLPA